MGSISFRTGSWLSGEDAMPRKKFEPPIYRFRVRILGGWYAPENARDIWREIEIAANQTLGDLGETIPLAFDFDDPHLWAFFLSGKAWDPQTEYALHPDPEGFPDEGTRSAHATRIPDVPLPGVTGKKEFLFLFDYGDEWHFGVKFLGTRDAVEPRTRYPRVVAGQGEAPPQYPAYEEDEDWDEEDDAEPEDGNEEAPGLPSGA